MFIMSSIPAILTEVVKQISINIIYISNWCEVKLGSALVWLNQKCQINGDFKIGKCYSNMIGVIHFKLKQREGGKGG